MIRVGSTITLDAWNKKFKRNQDWNHAWGAVPGNIIPRFLLGVRPLDPSFGKILVRPMPGPLEKAESTIPTIRGPVTVMIDNQSGNPFAMKLTIPVNMTSRVEIPLPNGEGDITVNGKVVSTKKLKDFAVIDNIGSDTRTFRTTTAVKKTLGRK